MQETLLTIHRSDLAALADIRLLTGLSAAADGDTIWLRYSDGDTGSMATRLKQLPVKVRYHSDTEKHLFIPGTRTPVGILPDLHWQSLIDFLPLDVPVSAMPGKTPAQIAVRLIPSGQEREGKALLTTLEAWKGWAELAPAARLQRLQFAVSARNEVMVIGQPLPPLPGAALWLHDNLLIPSGYDLEFPLAATSIAANLFPGKDCYIFFDTRGGWQAIDRGYFTEATRSAIRLTTGTAMDT